MFQAQGKNNFSDIQKLVSENGWQVHRVQNNSRKFIVMNDNETRVFNWINPIQSLYDLLQQKSFDEFINTNTVIMSGEGVAVAMKKERKTKKVSERSKVVVEISEKITETTLKIMSMKLVRGSEEHMALRAHLKSLCKQLDDLGINHRNFGTGDLTSEELREVRKRGEEKKRERKEKRNNKNEIKR
jgi:hypothetical protein